MPKTGYPCRSSFTPVEVPVRSRSVMATINFARREIEAKIVYVGPALSGKTTNVQVLHRLVPKGQRGELHQLSTDTDRTLFFDFIPVELGQIAGFTAHFKLFTVPGQVYYQQTRRAVLQGADGVVFVADSSAGRAQANLDAMIDLEQNLRAHGLDLASIPLVVQLNKRDVEDALPAKSLASELNPFDVPVVESIAASGYGVLDTLYKITEIATRRIRENLSGQKNAVRLQAIQRDERESEQQVVDDYLSRIHKVRPDEEASAERMKAAGRMRPDDVDSFLLEFVDREDDLTLDEGLPPAGGGFPEPGREIGAPPAFASPAPVPPAADPQAAKPPTVRAAEKKKGRAGRAEPTPVAREPSPPREAPQDVAAHEPAPPAAPVLDARPRETLAPEARPPDPLLAGARAPAIRPEPRAADGSLPDRAIDAGHPVAEARRPEARPQPPVALAAAPSAPTPAAPAPHDPAPVRPPLTRAPESRPPEQAPEPPRTVEPTRPPLVETGRPAPPDHLRSTATKPRYPEGPPIEAHVDAQALTGVLLREVVGSNVGADGSATIEIVLERGGVARRHLLRFVPSAQRTPWGLLSVIGLAALGAGLVGGMLIGWKFF